MTFKYFAAAAMNKIDTIKPIIQSLCKMKHVFIVFILYALGVTLASIYYGNYNDSFLSGFLINANSSILDFFVLGVILYYFEYRRQNKETINELLEDLGNLSKHVNVDLKIQKIKIIRQLNNKGVFNIDIPRMELGDLFTIKYLHFKTSELSGLNMENSNIRDCSFTGCTIQALNISKSKMKNVKFIKCKIKNIKAQDSKLNGVIFEDCYLYGGNFSNAEMKSCVLRECDLDKVVYTNANLRNANIIDAKNIDVNKLIEANTLDYIDCDSEIERQILSSRPSTKFTKGYLRG